MSTVQHRDLTGDDLHAPGPHAGQHRAEAADALTPEDIGAATTVHQHDAAYAALTHNHDAAYAAQGHNHNAAYAALGHNHDTAYAAHSHDHADLVKTDGTRAFSAPVAGKQFFSTPVAQTPGATVTINWAAGKMHRITLTQPCALTFLNAIAGESIVVEILGGYTPTFPAGTWWEGGTVPTWGNSVGSPDIIVVYFNGVNYFAQVFGLGFVQV